MRNKIMITALIGLMGTTAFVHPVDATSSKDQITKLKKEKAALQKEVKALKKQKNNLYSNQTSLKNKYSKLEKSHQSILKENKLLKEKVKTFSKGYQLLETSKQLTWNGTVLDKKYKSTPSLLLLKNTPYIPLDLAAKINNLPLRASSKSFDLGISNKGVSLSTLKHEKSTFSNILYNKTIEAKGKTNVSNIIFDSFSMESSALYYLNKRYSTFEAEVMVTPTSYARKFKLEGDDGRGMTFKVIDTKTNKILAEHDLNYVEDPVHIKLNVSQIDGLKFMVSGINNMKSATLFNPVLTK